MTEWDNTTSLFALRLLTASNLERLLARTPPQNSTTTRTGSIRFDDDEVWIPVLVFSILITILIVFLIKHYTIKKNLKIQLQSREKEVEEVEEDEKEKKTSIHIANTVSVIEEDETKKSILKCPRCLHVLDFQTTPSPRSEEMEEGTDKETTENNNGLEEEEEEEEFVKEMKKNTETVTSVTADSDKEKKIAAKKQRKKEIMELAMQSEKERKEKEELKKNNSLKI